MWFPAPLQISIIAISVLKVSVSAFCICFAVWDSSKRFQIIEAGIKNFIHSFFRCFFANFSNSQNGTNCSVSYTSLKWKINKEKSVIISIIVFQILSRINSYYIGNNFVWKKSQTVPVISIKVHFSFILCKLCALVFHVHISHKIIKRHSLEQELKYNLAFVVGIKYL